METNERTWFWRGVMLFLAGVILLGVSFLFAGTVIYVVLFYCGGIIGGIGLLVMSANVPLFDY